MPEDIEHLHHHHHHHHHSSSSASGSSSSSRSSSGGSDSSPFIKVEDIQDYSIRTFGRKSQTANRPLPEGTLSIVVFSVLITALAIAPVIITLMFRNKELAATNYQLRERLGMLMAKLEEQGMAKTGEYAMTPKARYIEDTPPPETTQTADTAAAKDDEPAHSARVTPPADVKPLRLDDIARSLGLGKKDLDTLKADMEVFPNGMRYEIGDDGEDALVPDPLAQNISNAVTLYFLGQKRDAASILRMVVGAKPLWPYAHFLLGVASGERAELERASLLFSAARALGALPPEGELYRASCALFQRSYSQAVASIDRISLIAPDDRELQIGPLPAPADAPAHILATLREAAGAANVKVVEW